MNEIGVCESAYSSVKAMSHRNGSVTAVTHVSHTTVLSRDCLPPCTVPFHSIHQSHITGPQKSTKCHDGHGYFGKVTKSFLDSKKKFKKKDCH